MSIEEVNVLKLTLHDRPVAYLAGYQNGRNVLNFAGDFREDTGRPTFSLITHPKFPNATKMMSEPWARNQRLHPILSNLLPEGALRELIAQMLKVHIHSEFALNLARNKNWFKVDFSYFERWAHKSDVPWRAIKPHLDETLEKARSLWPEALEGLPMRDEHQLKLIEHWSKLQADFRIDTKK